MNKVVTKIFRKLDTWYFERDRINKKLLKKKYIYHNKSFKLRNAEISSISIVVPCYNHSKYLTDALNSIIKQTRKPDEIIIIDDSSNDKTPMILNEFYSKYLNNNKIVIKRNKNNIGQSASINLGVSLASSELIMILNDDDYLMHDAIEHTLNIYNTNQDIYLLGSKSFYIYNEVHFNNLKKFTFSSLEKDEYILKKSFPEEVQNYVSGREIDMSHSSSSFLKYAWETVDGYIPNIHSRIIKYSDRDFQLRVNSIFPIAILENAALAFWRINSSVDQGLFS